MRELFPAAGALFSSKTTELDGNYETIAWAYIALTAMTPGKKSCIPMYGKLQH